MASEPLSASFSLRLFGAVEAHVQNVPLPGLHSRKAALLLGLLALHAEQEVRYSWLAECLWSESEGGSDNLRQTLKSLRKSLGEQRFRLVNPTKSTLRLDLTDADVDLLAFDRAIRRSDAASLQQAVTLHRGLLLAEYSEPWVLSAQEERQQQHLKALETLAHEASKNQDSVATLGYLRRAVVADPRRESAHRALIRALAETRDYSAVMQAYRDLRVYLRNECNSEPAEETQTLYRSIQEEARNKPSATAFVVRASLPSIPQGFVPAPLTPLIGRDEERAQISAFLNTARLVTLCGEGGISKTRLAIQAAADVRAAYSDGVWFVELISMTEPPQIARQVAATLKLDILSSQEPESSLIAVLREQNLLLILDNCEHLNEACAHFAVAVLTTCPSVKILTTSRQPLGVLGEICRRVAPLSFPKEAQLPLNAGACAEMVRGCPAAALFEARAGAVSQHFGVTAENARMVAHLCQMLDGIPLAIELAAVQITALPIEEIASKLEQSMQWLSSHSPTLLPHQQTLWAVIDRSYDLLTGQEKTLLQRLSVFADGWTVQMAEAVCTDPGLPTKDILPLLTSLTQKCLAVRRTQASRYVLLETIRDYARGKLEDSGAAGEASRQHGMYFYDWLTQTAQYERDIDQPDAWRQMEAVYPNLSAALNWAEATPMNEEINLQMTIHLQSFWQSRGYAAEGIKYLECALSRPALSNGESSELRADALSALGSLAWQQRNYERASRCFEQALPIYRAKGNTNRIAYTVMWQGNIAYHCMQYDKAHALYAESLAIGRKLNHLHVTAYALIWLGNVAYQRKCSDESRGCHEEALALARKLDDAIMQAHCLYNLAHLAWREEKWMEARAQHRECLELRCKIEDKAGMITSLEGIAYLALAQQEPESAARLLGAAEGLRQRQGTAISPSSHAEHIAGIERAQTVLGQAKFETYLIEGKELGLERVIQEALKTCAERR